ncbi:MAG: SWIM zinc finger family protein [Saprospiraceae bacterium]|nr:SWIM zinc finger family protein [Saprospiraceae bacterium]
MASSFGKTWWGEQFLNSLSNIDYSNRLPRGSSYARKGAVSRIDINENRIKAKVKGSRSQPYNVDIILPPFFNPERGKFIKKLTEKPTIISKLLNKELDPAVLEIAEQCDLKVFPKQWSDFKMQCSCPDWAVPCKHLAAVIYKICAEIDNNPFLIFELHNLDLPLEMQKLGIQLDNVSTEIPTFRDLHFSGKGNKRKNDNPESAYDKLEYSSLTSIADSLISLLENNPAFYQEGGDFKDKYATALNRIVKKTTKVVAGKIDLHDLMKINSNRRVELNHYSIVKVSVDPDAKVKSMMDGKDVNLLDLLAQLGEVGINRRADYQPSCAALTSAMHLSLHLLANGAVVPQIVRLKNNKYTIRWLPAMLSREVRSLVEKLDVMLPPDIFVWMEGRTSKKIELDTACNLLSLLITELMHSQETKEGNNLFQDLFFGDLNYGFTKPGEGALAGGIVAWIQKYYLTQARYNPQIVVEELQNSSFFLSIYLLDAGKDKIPIALKDILNEPRYQSVKYEVLQGLTQLSKFITGLDGYIDSDGSVDIVMDNANFTNFLMSIIPALKLLDVEILLPKSLQYILKPKPTIRVKAKAKGGKSFIRLDQLLDFDWQMALGEHVMTPHAFKKLLKKSDGLIKYKSNYIYVNPAELEKIYKHFNSTNELSAFQILRSALSEEYMGARIEMSAQVKKIIRELTEFQEVPLPGDLRAVLRPYQKRGYSWMYRNAKIGFGSVIADDMGWGKRCR